MKNENISKTPLGTERGGSLVFLMSIVMVLGVTTSSMLTLSSKRANLQRTEKDAHVAFSAADSGIDQAIALGNAGQFAALAQGASTDLATMNIGSASVDVRVNRLADSVVGATTTRTLRIESTASFGQESRSVVAFLRQVETALSLTANIPEVEAAVMLGDPFAAVTFNGNSFLINGDDKYINGGSVAGSSVLGLGIGPQSNGTAGDPTQITNQLASNQNDNVTGTGPDPSVGAVNPVQINAIISALAPYATMSVTNYSGTYTGNIGSYPSSPQLFYSDGDIKISGNGQGYGIMIIDGNLTISGNWDFVGLVFVGGKVTFSGGGNTKKLQGAIFIDGDAQDLAVSGNINLQYSSEAVTNVTNFLDTLNPPSSTTPYSFVSSAETRRLN